jgi:twitching motility protein PilT
MLDMKALLSEMVRRNASDLHLKVGRRPVLRVDSVLLDTEYDVATEEDLRSIAYNAMNDFYKRKFEEEKEVDFAFEPMNLGRYRTNIYLQRGHIGIALRRVQMKVPTFEELGLPPILGNIALSERGIILLTGTTSCGKSTTLASMINYINMNRKEHIMTIENPIEYIHTDQKSIINQREVGIDTDSFHIALKHVMRQDPDVIVIGEMRDAQSFMAALAASDTGHLVFSTLHTTNSAQVVGRILDFFPQNERDQIRRQIAMNLRAAVCQRLVPRASGTGVIPAVEILITSLTVQKLIYENKTEKLPAAIETGTDDGMQTFNQSLLKLYNDKLITREAALEYSSNPESLKMNMQGIFLDESKRILAS